LSDIIIYIITDSREKILTMEDHPTEDTPGAPHGLPHDQQPAGAPKKCVPFFDEDIVPSLPPDWKPPSFS
jgi:hypothetical protein